jgi:hypothetical protein
MYPNFDIREVSHAGWTFNRSFFNTHSHYRTSTIYY